MTNNVSLGSNPNLGERPLQVDPQLSYLYFIFSGRLQECNAEISSYQSALSSPPRSASMHASNVYYLAAGRFKRYFLLNEQPEDDLEGSILGFTEAVLSLPLPRCSPLPVPNIDSVFHDLTYAISLRAQKSMHPEDIKCSVVCLRCLCGLPHNVRHSLYYPIRPNLFSFLSSQVKLNLGDVDQDIEEMADLFHELLISATPTDWFMSLTAPIKTFADAVLHHAEDEARIHSEKVISCLQRARSTTIRLPDLHIVPLTLASCLFNRFDTTHSEDDYNEGTATLDELISFRGPGDTPSPERVRALVLAGRFSINRFVTSGLPEVLERAIDLNRTLLDGLSLEHPLRDWAIFCRSMLQDLRLDGSGLNNLIRRSSESGNLPSFRDLTASLPELSIRPLSITTWNKHTTALRLLIMRRTDVADIEDGINYCQQLIASYPDDSLADNAHSALVRLFHLAFECKNDIEYLNRAISAARNHLNTTTDPRCRSITLYSLIPCLFVRLSFFLSTGDKAFDKDELIQMLEMAAENKGMAYTRLKHLSQWAFVARLFEHSSVSTAYDRAMSLMQDSLTLAPTLDMQHSQLVVTIDHGNYLKSLPFDYASYQIDTSQLEQAIETLERGRALLWSEMRGLRTSLDQIRSIDPDLAHNFATINRELETVTLAISSKSNVNGRVSDIDAVDPFGHLVVRQRKLLDDREKLISQIQALPGLDTFLGPPSFESLRSAARHGPVIIINHSFWRSDIIILHHNSPPSLIATSNDFYARANKLQDQLMGARKEDSDLESNTYEDALRSVLEELYDLVGRPVIEKLNELNVPKQSRVWWCPTSVFCSLPLHAMGPVQSDVDPPQYFLDLYIPSYIPSLSALIESRKPGSQMICKPSILLVAHPDENMPAAPKEMRAVQAVDTQVTTLFLTKATRAAVLSRLCDHQFVHIVSHGILEPGKPFEASFKLHKGKRLQLLDIIRSQLPDAEFAFLSACHTAELTEKSILDEVLHLAAAMQFCGFRSVVGTMWAMADIDGPDLARHFYESVFSDEAQAGRYHERTAGALRDAVFHLRRKGGISLERWVNFVHYGA
jgi:CHAT domain-containing protein